MKSLILSLLISASAILAESQFDHAARSEFLNDENKVTDAKDESRPHQPIIVSVFFRPPWQIFFPFLPCRSFWYAIKRYNQFEMELIWDIKQNLYFTVTFVNHHLRVCDKCPLKLSAPMMYGGEYVNIKQRCYRSLSVTIAGSLTVQNICCTGLKGCPK